MKTHARIAHHIKGRVRIQMGERRGDKAFFERLSEQLAGHERVQNVRANPVTGSVVLEFAGALEELLAGLAPLLPELDWTEAGAAAIGRALLKQPDSPFRLVSGRDINPMAMVGTVFGAIGVLQTLRGKVMIPALSAYWYAANAFRVAAGPTPAMVADADVSAS